MDIRTPRKIFQIQLMHKVVNLRMMQTGMERKRKEAEGRGETKCKGKRDKKKRRERKDLTGAKITIVIKRNLSVVLNCF